MIQGVARRKLAIELTVRLAEGLLQAGCSAHRLEEMLLQTAYSLDLDEASCLAMPTGAVMSFGADGAQVIRVPMQRHNLSRFTELTQLQFRITHDESPDPVVYLGQLEEITSRAPLYTNPQRVAAYTVAGMIFSLLLGGGWAEAAVGLLVGLTCGLNVIMAERNHRLARMTELVTGLTCGAVAQIASYFIPCSAFLSLVAAILFALPGVAFVLGLAELANRSVLAGTARVNFALVALVQVLIGAALSDRLVALIVDTPDVPPSPLPLWGLVLLLPFAGVAISVFMRSRVQDIPWVITCSSIAFVVTRLINLRSGEDWLASFVGAIAVGIFSNIYARRTKGPGVAMLVSGIYLLGPASLGLRGLSAIFGGNVMDGITLGFQMAMRGMGLVVGLLSASLLIPPPPPATRKEGTARHLWHSDRL